MTVGNLKGMKPLNLKPRIVLRAAPLLAAGALFSAFGAVPAAVASIEAAPISSSVFDVPMNEPGGGGCVGDVCGSGGVDGGPGGGPGGSGCVHTPQGEVCGSGGLHDGPGGLPGGEGCIPGLGCGSGHG